MWTIVGTIIGLFAVGWIFPPALAAGLALAAFLAVLIGSNSSNDCYYE